MATLGIIGGSGFYRVPELDSGEEITITTPFGEPSGAPRAGRIGSTDVVFIPRHGSGHRFAPSTVNYRANLYALKALGTDHVLSVSAVGSLEADLPPRSLVLPDQIIDRTHARARSFFDQGVVAHVGIADPFCPIWRNHLIEIAEEIELPVRQDGTYICIEGPQFSTRAESRLFRHWGGTVIGMTAMPEARLAREAELCYATLATVTDYDVWHDAEEDVSVAIVLGHLQANVAATVRFVRAIAERPLPDRACPCAGALQDAIMTDPRQISASDRARLGIIGQRYLAAGDQTE